MADAGKHVLGDRQLAKRMHAVHDQCPAQIARVPRCPGPHPHMACGLLSWSFTIGVEGRLLSQEIANVRESYPHSRSKSTAL